MHHSIVLELSNCIDTADLYFFHESFLHQYVTRNTLHISIQHFNTLSWNLICVRTKVKFSYSPIKLLKQHPFGVRQRPYLTPDSGMEMSSQKRTGY